MTSTLVRCRQSPTEKKTMAIKLEAPLVAWAPEDTSRLFKEAANAHALDALMTLYEPSAVSASSATDWVQGHDAIREALSGLLSMNPTFVLIPIRIMSTGELAMVTGDWTMEGTGPDGSAVSV